MKTINALLIFSLLSLTNFMHSSEDDELIQKFFKNPIETMRRDELNRLNRIISSEPHVFNNPQGIQTLCHEAVAINLSTPHPSVLKIEYLIAGGADRGCNKDGFTAANIVTCDRHITHQPLITFLSCKPHLDALNEKGQTALEFATRRNRSAEVNLLVKAGARDKKSKLPYEIVNTTLKNIDEFKAKASSEELSQNAYDISNERSEALKILNIFDTAT